MQQLMVGEILIVTEVRTTEKEPFCLSDNGCCPQLTTPQQ